MESFTFTDVKVKAEDLALIIKNSFYKISGQCKSKSDCLSIILSIINSLNFDMKGLYSNECDLFFKLDWDSKRKT